MTDAPAITRVVGSMVEARPLGDASLYELVRVGARGLMGEVIRIRSDVATIQVFEETSGLALGEPVTGTQLPLCALLGPGLLGAVVDGVGRRLSELANSSGNFIMPGALGSALDATRRWPFKPSRRAGDSVAAGDVLGSVEESPGLQHLIMVPVGVEGVVSQLDGGDFAIEEPIGQLASGAALTLSHAWPVRRQRPRQQWLRGDRPFVTGQRVLDFLFPVVEGGSVAVPGGFGTGKTVIEQSLAKYAEADIVIYIGCGERGNEMAELLEEFPRLSDPRHGRALMQRTIMIVNTSNMPVAAREASVYLGMTYAEYYRDMGYRVTVLADSLSRWAETMREISSLLGEMPGEEGYPTSLSNRLAHLYERAGRVRVLGTPERQGAVTFISALSPPGGDFSEPVTQASMRVVGALWGLDARLARQRQFPAVDWEVSYSLDVESVMPWLHDNVGAAWGEVRQNILGLLQRDRELREIVGLVGLQALDEKDRLVLESARLLRTHFLGQSASDPADAFSPLAKTYAIAVLIDEFHQTASAAVEAGRTVSTMNLVQVFGAVESVRSAAAEELDAEVTRARSVIRDIVGRSS